jgi:hypothetical protein
MQLRDKGIKPAQPVDGESTKPGWFKYGGPPEELAVSITWGEEGGRQFIRVEDNGVGMTIETIERYFTQIGKSFYKSPDFHAEQAEMRHHGLIATPISTFGIGVLSCFMIADRVQVRTHPGNVSDSRPCLDLEISGPGSLFWTRPGTRERQGSEVTLWLRKQHKLIEQHDRDNCFARLRKLFGYTEKGPEKDTALDPGLIAATHVVWPKYPVHVQPPGQDRWTIDDRFHVEQLAPIDTAKFHAKLADWDYPADCAGSPQWELIDWTDDRGDDATGTRLRIWQPVDSAATLADWELRTFVEPLVKQTLPLLIVQSMRVPDVDAILSVLPCAPGPGCRIWVDLRGPAIPRLKADRGAALVPSGEGDWTALLGTVWGRRISQQGRKPDTANKLLWHTWRPEFARTVKGFLPKGPRSAWLYPGSPSGKPARRLALPAFLMDLALDRDLARDLARSLALALGRDRSEGTRTRMVSLLETHILQETFFPDLSRSWPALGLQGLEGRVGNAILTAPAGFRFELNDRKVAFADQSSTLPTELNRYEYDLCFPMTAVPLGRLRRDFPAWREDRRYRPLAVLPFLLSGPDDVWRKHAERLSELFAPIMEIYALQPAEELWYKPFAEWTPADWQHKDHESLLWDIRTGILRTAKGVHKRANMPKDRP